jgi:hypothetical protein
MKIEWNFKKLIWITLPLVIACIVVLGVVDLSKYLGSERIEKMEISRTDIIKQVPGVLNEKDSENKDKGKLKSKADKFPRLQDTEVAKNRDEGEQNSEIYKIYQHEEKPEKIAAAVHNGLKVRDKIKLEHRSFAPEEREEVPKGESAVKYTPVEEVAEKGQGLVKTKDKFPVSESKDQSNKASLQGKEIHRTLKFIKSGTTEDGFNLMLVADTPIRQYKTFFLTDPSRLVIDLMGEWKISNQDKLQVINQRVKKIRFGVHQNKLRIVVDLNNGTQLRLSVDKMPNGINLIIKNL